jgi:hypothetical protein
MIAEVSKHKSFEERETVPDKACGVCQNFSESAYTSDGRGTCRVLRAGSSIDIDRPVYVTDGDTALMTFFNTEGSRCNQFGKMAMIDKDATECADPAFRRAQRQMEGK